MALTKVSTIGIATGISLTGVTTTQDAKVGTGITLSPDGNIYATGVVTATSYVGDGSSLTGVGQTDFIDAESINCSGITTVGTGITLSPDGNIYATGVVTATSYVGDGSALTGVAATNNIRTGILDVAGVGTFRNDVNIPDKIIHLGDTNTSIRFPAADTVSVETAGSEALRVDSSQRTLIGAVANNNVGAFGGSALQVEGLNAPTSSMSLLRHSDDTAGSTILMGKSRGTSDAATTIVQSGDSVARLIAYGADGGDIATPVGGIEFEVDGTPGSDDMPGRIVLKTTADGANDYTERLRIDSAGAVIISNTFNSNTSITPALCIGSSSHSRPGIVIRGSATNKGDISWCDNSGTDGSDGVSEGLIRYDHATDHMEIHTADAERVTIDKHGNTNITGICTAAAFYPSAGQLSNRNIIINGDMSIWQRGTSGVNMSQNKYLVDRFKAMSSSDGEGAVSKHANVPTQTQTGGTTFGSALRINCTTADTSLASGQYIIVSQRIEGQNLRHLGFGLAGTRYVTLSFWQRSPAGTYHVSFRNASYNRYYIASYTAASNTYEKHVITIPVDTSGTWGSDHSMGLDITWSLGCGSNNSGGTVGSWSAGSKHAGSGNVNMYSSTSNDFYLTGVQFEAGSYATPYESLSYGAELLRCQRYCYNITAPEGFIASTEDLGIGFASSGTEAQFPLNFPVQMRATPSVEQVQGTEYFLLGQGNYGGNKFLSNNFIINNMSPAHGNLYTAPDSNLGSYIGQIGTLQSKNTAARLRMVSEM